MRVFRSRHNDHAKFFVKDKTEFFDISLSRNQPAVTKLKFLDHTDVCKSRGSSEQGAV